MAYKGETVKALGNGEFLVLSGDYHVFGSGSGEVMARVLLPSLEKLDSNLASVRHGLDEAWDILREVEDSLYLENSSDNLHDVRSAMKLLIDAKGKCGHDAGIPLSEGAMLEVISQGEMVDLGDNGFVGWKGTKLKVLKEIDILIKESYYPGTSSRQRWRLSPNGEAKRLD